MSDPSLEFQSLTRAVRQGTIPWSVQGYVRARTVVRRARSGKLKLQPGVAGLPPDLLEDAELDQVALGLWLRREYGESSPEVPAAHHLRFYTVEQFLEQHADLLVEEGLLRQPAEGSGEAGEAGEAGPEPDPLLLTELVERPYDTALTSRTTPTFDLGEVLKAVARRAR